jgi:stage V sporulation protein R
MALSLKELEEWDNKIREWVDHFGLNCYPQEFEICDHNEMIGYMAYSGMPSRYAHWSFGKDFERQKTLYDYGVSGLPYEMVINSNPCLAYLMQDNTDLLQILTMAHVYGHNDFFATNFTFTSNIDAKYTIEMFKGHANRVSRYLEDPSIGLEAVEQFIDHAHSLSMQRSRNMGIRRRSADEQKLALWQQAQPKDDPYREIHPAQSYTAPDLDKVPLEPDENILEFIAKYNPYLAEWQRDILHIVDREARYFIPQMETKIMNEGWASYWHHKILNRLELSTDLHFEFLVRHNQVLRPTPGGLNPYHLGFVIWHDIERRWNEGDTGREYSEESAASNEADSQGGSDDENNTPGRKKIFGVRESDRDSSFLRRFLTRDIIRELELFQHEKRGKERVVTKVADDDSWQEIKESLIKGVGTGSIPVIKVVDADFGRKRTLHLMHYHDGRDLQLEYAERTLKHVRALWGRDVVLESELGGKRALLKLSGDTLKVDKPS